MNCELIRRWLGAYLDGELELTRRLDLEAHLAACSTCKTAAEEAANFESWVRVNMPVYKTPPELKARIQASLRREFQIQIESLSHFWRPWPARRRSWCWASFSLGPGSRSQTAKIKN